MDFNGKISAYPPKLSETQLQTVSIARALSRPPLGFTRSLVDVWCMAEVLFFYDLDGLGGIHSTQPTMLILDPLLVTLVTSLGNRRKRCP